MYWTDPSQLDPLPDCTHLKQVSVNSLGWFPNGLLRDWADKQPYISELLRRDLGGLLLLLLFNTLLYSPTLSFCDVVNHFPCDESSDRNSNDSVDYLECVKRHVYLLFNN